VNRSAPARAAPGPPSPGRFRRFAAAHPRRIDVVLAAVYAGLSLLALLAAEAARHTAGQPPGLEVTGPGAGRSAPPASSASPAEPAPDSLFDSAFGGFPAPTAWRLTVILGCIALYTAGIIAWRRRRPVWLGAAALVVEAGMMLAMGTEDLLAVWIALFALAQRVSGRAAALVCAAALALDAALVFAGLVPSRSAVGDFLGIALMNVTATTVFIHFGNRGRYVAALVDLNRHLELERDQRARIAVADERARIAREMHDIVAHSLAVMVTVSDGAAAQAERDPLGAATAMERVSETGRHAVGDMRRMLEVLRSDSPPPPAAPPAGSSRANAAPAPATAPLAGAADGSRPAPEAVDWLPQPGLANLVGLVATFRAAGLPVELNLAASLTGDPGLELTVFRIVQESLTNALRYAPDASRVDVRLEHGRDGAVIIRVADHGGARPAGPGGWDGTGQGIVGMRQRAAVYGGTLEAGPSGDGWSVRAELRPGEGER
jgi:signal transduction histidine kinase